MFNIGGGELLVIALVALIVLGPQRLPDAARQAGKAMGELRRLSAGFQNELKDAFSESETTHPTTARRDVLASPVEPTATLSSAVTAVSSQPRARRTPLKAAPPAQHATTNGVSSPKGRVTKQAASAKKATPTKGAGPAKKAPAAKTSARAAPVSTAHRPRSKGS